MSSRPGLSEQFLRHRLLQSLPDPSRSNHGELPESLFGNSELAALLQDPAHFPDEMSVEQSVARPACGPAFHSCFRSWFMPSHPRPRQAWLMLSTWRGARLAGLYHWGCSAGPLGSCWCERLGEKWRKNLSRLAADSSLKPEHGNSREKWLVAIIRANDPAHGYEGGTNLATSPSA